MERVVSVDEVRAALARLRRDGRTVGFVPTMGALHDGHLSLVRASRRHADVTVVSIFVNPTQFGPGEDFEAYPRDLDSDTALLADEGVDILLTPTVDAMYPPGADTHVDPGRIGTVLCGAARPGHFTGVATVVTKLFQIVTPDIAFFGEKDYQQLKILEKVARDLDMRVRVAGCPIVREPDGLAMSSRNRYLSPDQRSHATVLYRALATAHDAACAGETDAGVLTRGVRETIDREEGVELEYAVVVDAETLDPVSVVQRPARALVAARVGSARLIDNVAIPLPGTGPSR
ncbi:MAG: pantoate--beta-alanine ligase [Coriobacteriia bacterium]|nr:pantoate--beta-alanine ligase [Coriobacteriia bacterium]